MSYFWYFPQIVVIIILIFMQPQAHLDQPKPVCMALAIPPTNTTQFIAETTSLVVVGGPNPTSTCIWTQHTSLEGMTYYYNSVTGESQVKT